MGEVIGIIIGVVVSVGAFFFIFWGLNKVLDLAPTQWPLFLAVVGILVGLLIGAFLNGNGVGGGFFTIIAGAVVGGVLGVVFALIRPPGLAKRKLIVDKTRPWVFLSPALLAVSIGLIIPTIRTGVLSFKNQNSTEWVGLENFGWIFTSDDIFNVSGWTGIFGSLMFWVGVVALFLGVVVAMRRGRKTGVAADYDSPWPVSWSAVGVTLVLFAVFTSLRGVIWNNLWWVFAVTVFSTALGLFVAVVTDKMNRWGTVAKALIFLPMAISMVGASVIWRFVYVFRPEGETQIGALNAVWTAIGQDPVAWLIKPPWNTFFLIIVMIWIQTGFAMIVLAASLKAVPTEQIEAATVDGASEGDIFWRVTLPTIRSTIAVVVTTLIVVVMKVYDIVKVMTNGEFQTNVIANEMFDQAFRFSQAGRGSALATVLFLFVIPIMFINIKRVRKEAAIR